MSSFTALAKGYIGDNIKAFHLGIPFIIFLTFIDNTTKKNQIQTNMLIKNKIHYKHKKE